ncbi:MAG: cyclase family protein [Chelatococcus sp.]|uniref:cyclase family protein n=1 Tax=Chelatococcus sp. TaxID=1953771 RepID=UPI0025B9E77C|nr:cyclase family protein [Chelatococcus sp.]MBX3540960.1 cyclase family protein [Chelatococcus sp.]
MMARIVDLSIPIENDVVSDPDFSRPKITYLAHDVTIDRMRTSFPSLEAHHLPDGAAWAIETLEVTTHHGTHLDAPYHFHPTTNHDLVEGGEPSPTIDEIPLEWCFKPGVKLDFRHFPDGYVATVDDVIAELDRIGHTLQPLDIVLINTRAGSRYSREDYVTAGCGVGREATLFLARQGIKITGTDAWSWDAPFNFTREKVEETGDYGLVWEGHKAGRERLYCHLEKLHQLEVLPPTGFTVACFPVKIRKASAGWTRAVAIL